MQRDQGTEEEPKGEKGLRSRALTFQDVGDVEYKKF